MRLHLIRPAAAGRYPGILLYSEISVMPEFATAAGYRRHPAPVRRPVPSNRAAQRGDNEIYRARVLKVRIHFPPAVSLRTIGSARTRVQPLHRPVGRDE